MFALGFSLLFILSMCEIFTLKHISKDLLVKNVQSVFAPFITVIFSIITITIFFKNEINFQLYNDYRFYIGASFEIISFSLIRKNFELNGENISAINMALFLSVPFVIIFSYYLSPIFSFNPLDIDLKYSSETDVWVFAGVSSLLLIFYFSNKLNSASGIKNFYVLTIMPISMSFSMFIMVKLMQEYNSYLVFGSTSFFMGVAMLYLAIRSDEIKNYSWEKNGKDSIKISIVWLIAMNVNLLAIKILAVELVTLFKRIAQMIAGHIYDYSSGKYIFSLRDASIVVALSGVGYYYG